MEEKAFHRIRRGAEFFGISMKKVFTTIEKIISRLSVYQLIMIIIVRIDYSQLGKRKKIDLTSTIRRFNIYP